MEKKIALLAGANGLVGGLLLESLLDGKEYNKVVVLVRETLGISNPKLEEHIINFNELHRHGDKFDVDDVFCCLGTTIKKAGSKEAFKKVDLDYPLIMARLAKENNVSKYLIISAIGANPQSGIFYNRTKGMVEEGLRELAFSSTHIFRPSLLLDTRKELHIGEKIGGVVSKPLSFAMVGVLKRYRPIEAHLIAKAMYIVAQRNATGFNIYESEEIRQIAIK